MVYSEVFSVTLRVFITVLNGFGVLACLWFAFFYIMPALNKNLRVSLTPALLYFFRFLENRSVLYMLAAGFVCLVLNVLIVFKPDLLSLTSVLLIAVFFGFTVVFVIAPKGLLVPLGSGLSVSFDKSPKVGVGMSKYVLSFHVGKFGIKKARNTIELLIRAVNSAKVAGCEYDLVLKSWVFAKRDNKKSNKKLKQVGEVKFVMYMSCGVFWTYILCLFLFFVFCSLVSVDESNDELLMIGFWVLCAGAGVVLLTLIFMWYRARGLMQVICADPSRCSRTHSTWKLEQKILANTHGYHGAFIAHQPLSPVHFFAMCLLKPLIIKTFGGAEAGIVLIRS